MGLLRRGLAYRLLKLVEWYQYGVADTIGVQTPASLPYLRAWSTRPRRHLEVLQNWLADAPDTGTSLMVSDGPLAGRTIFVYVGNMGVAQGMDILLELAQRLRSRGELGFLFVGRGSDASRLKASAEALALDNVVFHEEVEPSEIPGLLTQCHIGLVALDTRHRTHNIPGKFLTYLQAGLPVLARINPGNDLANLIDREGIGRVCTDNSIDTLHRLALEAGRRFCRTGTRGGAQRCRAVFANLFLPTTAATQIIAALR